MEINKLPYDIDMERQVLSALFITDADCFDTLRPEHFYRTDHAHIYQAMQSLHHRQEPIESTLVIGELKSLGHPIYSQAILDILSYPPSADIAASSRKITGYYQLRELYKACHATQKRALAAGPDDVPDVLSYLQCEMQRVDFGTGSAWCHISDIIDECMEKAEELAKRGGITGVPSGFRDLDWYTSGFQPGDLAILAARPSMGKTAFAMNSIANAAEKGFKSGFLSLEMSKHQVGNRFISMRSSINALKFRSGRFVPQDWDRMVSTQELLSKWGVWIDDHPRASYQDVHSKCRALLQKHGASALWIDYLGFLDGDKDANKVQEIQSITRALKATAKEFSIPIVLVAQLSRECEKRPNKRPILSDLRDSGAIEQDADLVLFLYRDDYYKPESKEPGITEVSISKQRNGPTGTIKLLWQDEYTRFQNIAKEAA